MEHNKPKGKEIVKETLSAVATNPGGIIVNPLRWISTNPKPFFKQFFSLILGYFLVTKIHWLFFPIPLCILAWIALYWFNVRTTFKVGAVNPGKVISLNPDKIAVATNLSKGFGDYPIIKIVELELLEEDKVINKIIPTVAGYNNNPYGYPFWSEFHPSPINHGVTNKTKVLSYMNRITENEIALIDERLSKIGNINVPETYKVDIESSGWKDYKNVPIGKLSRLLGPKDLEKIESKRPNLELKATQLWNYHTREIEKNSVIQILKIDNTESGDIVHISIKDVHFKRDINNPATIGHIPIEISAFKNSITKWKGIKKVDPSYEEGYNQWKNAFDTGSGGIFTNSIAQIVDSLDQVVPET